MRPNIMPMTEKGGDGLVVSYEVHFRGSFGMTFTELHHVKFIFNMNQVDGNYPTTSSTRRLGHQI